MTQIKLPLYSKTLETKDGRKFKTFQTKMLLYVDGEKERGKQLRTLNLKFVRGIDTSKFKRGYILVNPLDVNGPFVYKVGEKDGKKVYPEVWVKNVVEYVEQLATHNQNDFYFPEELKNEDLPY